MQPLSQLFLCYRRPDRQIAETLYCKLKDAGFDPWIDGTSHRSGVLPETIAQRALRESAVVLLCLSDQAIDRYDELQDDFNLTPVLLDKIMEGGISVIPILLQAMPVPESVEKLTPVELTDRRGAAFLLNRLDETLKQLLTPKFTPLRAKPCSAISTSDARAIIRKLGLRDLAHNPFGLGIRHQYQRIKRHDIALISDWTTGLMWRQKGSHEPMHYHDAGRYITSLNQHRHAGYSDWRLPTLEEAVSLMEPVRSSEGIYLSLEFDSDLMSIWTADSDESGKIWNVNFCFGYSYSLPAGSIDYVCAVRTSSEILLDLDEWQTNSP